MKWGRIGLLLAALAPAARAQEAIPVALRRAVIENGRAVLPSDSEVWLTLVQQLDSRVLREGGTFALAVSRDVMVGDYLVIPRGTPAHGRIAYRTGKGAFGKSAKMEFDLVDLTLGGRTIPLGAHYRISGEGNAGAAVGAIVAAGVLAGALVTGHSAVAEPGTEYRAFTRAPLNVALPPAPVIAAAEHAVRAPAVPPAGRRSRTEDTIEVAM